MSDGNFGESQAHLEARDAKQTRNPLIHWLGAMASVGVLGVMVYWGLQLVQRDPNEVPVIKAMEGPARVLPEDPGGTRSNYTGLAVNSVQSEGEAEKTSDRVVLAPAPRRLLPEDVPVAAQDSVVAEADKPVAELILDSVESAISDGGRVATLSEPADGLPADSSITLTIRDVPEGMRLDTSGGVAKLVVDEDTVSVPEETVQATSPPGTKYAPKSSLVPQFRTSAVRLAKAGTASGAPAKPLAREVPDAPLGTRLIQLGAYDSRETALKEWVRISGKHYDLLGNKSFLVQPVQTGGRQFYRLRAVGFADSTESKSMCAALVQRGAQCIPVVAR